jgi:hypothetical protein
MDTNADDMETNADDIEVNISKKDKFPWYELYNSKTTFETHKHS